MDIKVNITLADISDRDLDKSERLNNDILEASLEAAGQAMLAVNERRMQRFIRFCNTGKFVG